MPVGKEPLSMCVRFMSRVCVAVALALFFVSSVCACVFLTKVIDILFMCCHGDVHIPGLTNLKVALKPCRCFC